MRPLGTLFTRVPSVCCSLKCADALHARLKAERYVKHPPDPLRDRIPWPWKCSECGKGLPEVNRERKRLELRPVNTGRQRVCSDACAKLTALPS